MKSKNALALSALSLTALFIVSCGPDVPFTLVGQNDDVIVPRPGSDNDSEDSSNDDESGDGNCMFYLTGEGGEGGPDLFVQLSSKKIDEYITEGQPDPFQGPLAFKVDPNAPSKITISNTGWKTSYLRLTDPADIRINAKQTFSSEVTYSNGEMEFEIPSLSMSLVHPVTLEGPYLIEGYEDIGPILLSTQANQEAVGDNGVLNSDGMPANLEQGPPYPVKLVGPYVFNSFSNSSLGLALNDYLLGGAIIVEITGYLDRLPEEACSGDGPPPPEDEEQGPINVGPEEFNIVDKQGQLPVDKYEDMLALVGVKEAFGQTILNCKEKGVDERQIEIKNILEDDPITITKIEVFDSDGDNIKHCLADSEFSRGTLKPGELGADCEEINSENYMPPCTLNPGAVVNSKIIYRPYNYFEPQEGEEPAVDTGYVVFTYQVGEDGPEKQYEFPLKGITAPTPKDHFFIRRQGNTASLDSIKFSIPKDQVEPLTLDLELVSTSPDAWIVKKDDIDNFIKNDEGGKFTGPNWNEDQELPKASEDNPTSISFQVTYDPGADEQEVHEADLEIKLEQKSGLGEYTVKSKLTGSKGIPDIGDEGYKYSVQIQVVGGYINGQFVDDGPLWAGPFYVNGREYPAAELKMTAKKIDNSDRLVKVKLWMPDSYSDFNNNDDFLNNFVEKLGGSTKLETRRDDTIRMWNLQGSKNSNGGALSSDARERPIADCDQPSDLSKSFEGNFGCAHFYMALFDEVEEENEDKKNISGVYDTQTGMMIFPGKDDEEGVNQGVTLSIGNFYHAQLGSFPASKSVGDGIDKNDYRIRTYLQGTLFTGTFNKKIQNLIGLDANQKEVEREYSIVSDEEMTVGMMNIKNNFDDGPCPENYLNSEYWDVIKGGDVLTEEEVLSATPTFNCYKTDAGFLKGLPVMRRKNQPESNQDIWYFDTIFGFVGRFPGSNKNAPVFMNGTSAHFALQVRIKAEPCNICE